MRFFQSPDLAALGAVADLHAEKLDLHVFRHDGGGIDDDERSVGARRERVNGAGGELLAAAGGADDQHPAIGRPDFLHDLPEMNSSPAIVRRASRPGDLVA